MIDMNEHVKEILNSFALKRKLWQDYQDELDNNLFLTKKEFIDTRFKMYPDRLKKLLIENI